MSFDKNKTYKLETLTGRIIQVDGTTAERFAKYRPNQYRLVKSKGKSTSLTLEAGNEEERENLEQEKAQLEKEKAEFEKMKAEFEKSQFSTGENKT